MSPSLRCVAAVLLMLSTLVTATAQATQVQFRSVESLGVESALVVRGEVSSVRAYWNDARTRILTEVSVRISERFKGSAGREVRIVQMGGVLDGVRMTVAGSLEWLPGEDVVLFLEDSLPNRFRVAGFTQGKFEVQRDPRTGEEFVRQASFTDVELVGDPRGRAPVRLSLDELLNRALPGVELERGQ